MDGRLPAQLLIGALIRRVQDAGGFATVLHRSDAGAGAILVQTLDRGQFSALLERVGDGAGGYVIDPVATSYWGNQDDMARYLEKRIRNDPDLWLVELDIPEAKRFIAEILA